MGAINGVWKGILMGLVANLLGYFKSKKIEKFEPMKLISKLVIGLIVGGVAGGLGMPYDRVEAWMATFGLIEAIDYFVKMIWRRLIGKKDKKPQEESKPELSKSESQAEDKPQETEVKEDKSET